MAITYKRATSTLSSFYQYDVNQSVIVSGDVNVGDAVHITNSTLSNAIIVALLEKADGTLYFNIPDSFFETATPIKFYIYPSNGTVAQTVATGTFNVLEREKPENYVASQAQISYYANVVASAVARVEGAKDEAIEDIGDEADDKKAELISALEAKETALETTLTQSVATLTETAGGYATTAQDASSSATSAKNSAVQAKNNAETFALRAETASTSAQTAKASVDSSKQAVDTAVASINGKGAEIDAKVTAGISSIEDKKQDAIIAINSNATAKTDSFNTNASAKTSAYDQNASTKVSDYNSNATEKTTAFNSNYTQKSEALTSQSQSIASQLDSKRADYDHLEKYVGVTYDVGNIWDEEWELGKYSYDDGQKTDSNNSIRSKNMIGISPSAKYYITFATFNAHYHNKYFYDASGKFLSYDGSDSCFFTSPDDARYMSIAINADYGTTYNHDISIKKVHGTEPTTWEKTYSAWGNCLGDIDDRLSSVEDLSAREGREKSELLKTIDSQSHSIANQQYRIKNLEAITKGDIYSETTSTTSSGSLSLPSSSPLAPYASIDKILGKTVVVDGALQSSSIAKVTSTTTNADGTQSSHIVNLPQNADGTPKVVLRSAGSVHDEYNPDTGKVLRRVGYKTLSSSDSFVYYSGVCCLVHSITGRANNQNVVSDKLQTNTSLTMNEQSNLSVRGATDSEAIIIKNTSIDNAQDFINYVSGMTIYYELAEPYEDETTYTPIDSFIEVEAGGTVSVVSTGAQAEATITYQTDLSTGGNA